MAKKTGWIPTYHALSFVWNRTPLFIETGLTFLTPSGVAFGRCDLGALTLVILLKLKKSIYQKI